MRRRRAGGVGIVSARTVVLTREAGYNDELRQWIPAGYDVTEVPLTTTHYESLETVRERLEDATNVLFETLVVTSVRTQRYLDLVRPFVAPDVVVGTVGAATAGVLAEAGFPVSLQSDIAAAALAPDITRGPVLLLGAEESHPVLPDSLLRQGLAVAPVACYQTLPAELDEQAHTALATADVVIIAAPSAWRVAQPFVRPSTLVVVPGATTHAAVAASHPRVAVAWGEAVTRLLATRDVGSLG